MRLVMTMAAALLLVTACANGVDEAEPDDQAGEVAGSTTEPDDDAMDDDVDVDPDVQVDEEPADAPEFADQPGWAAPPVEEFGAAVGIAPIIVEGDGVAVGLTSITAFTEGALLQVSVRYDPDGESRSDDVASPLRPDSAWIEAPDDELPDDVLRVGIELPDGTTVATADEYLDPIDPDTEVEGPVLLGVTGVGDELSWDEDVWLWPAVSDDDGSAELIIDWPDRGIEDERAELDLGAIADAADDAVEPWSGVDNG